MKRRALLLLCVPLQGYILAAESLQQKARMEVLQGRVRELITENSQLKKEKADREAAYEQLTQAAELLGRENTELLRQKADLLSAADLWEVMYQELVDEVEDKKRQLRALGQQHRNLDASHAALSSRVTEAQKALELLAAQFKAIRLHYDRVTGNEESEGKKKPDKGSGKWHYAF